MAFYGYGVMPLRMVMYWARFYAEHDGDKPSIRNTFILMEAARSIGNKIKRLRVVALIFEEGGRGANIAEMGTK